MHYEKLPKFLQSTLETQMHVIGISSSDSTGNPGQCATGISSNKQVQNLKGVDTRFSTAAM